jgi:ssDNA thymidine ADP-ribosyltransferase DarT-like protein
MNASTLLDTEQAQEVSTNPGTKSIKELYYITHVDNIPSIIRHGILSHELILSRKVSYTPIYDEEIVSNRRRVTTPNGKTLWSFANLYFQPPKPNALQSDQGETP